MGFIDVFNKIKDAIILFGDQLVNLATRIDNVQFNETFIVTRLCGLLHFILGTPLYSMMCLLFYIGVGFILYRIAKHLVNIIIGFIPGLRGKIHIG